MGTHLVLSRISQTHLLQLKFVSVRIHHTLKSVEMAAAFVGKWDLMEATNVREVLAASGVTNEFLTLAKQMKENDDAVVQEIAADGDKVSVTYYKNGNKEDMESFTLESVFEVSGSTATATVTCGGVVATAKFNKL